MRSSQRTNLIARQKLFDFIRHCRSVIGAIALNEKDRSLVVRSSDFLQRGEEDEEARAFAMLDDADYVKIVIEETHVLAELYFL